MSHRWLFALVAFLATGAHAQWLNFPTPGTPRTRDGKPNLAAPVPRAPDGKPDLSGVWMHEITSVAEVQRLFGSQYDADITLAPPGMEIGTQHKYAFDILADFKPGEAPLRPEIAARFRRAPSFGPGDPALICTGVMGFPLADLLSTFTGAWTLQQLGALDRLDAADVVEFVDSLELPIGGYHGGIWDEATDVEYTFYGLGATALFAT